MTTTEGDAGRLQILDPTRKTPESRPAVSVVLPVRNVGSVLGAQLERLADEDWGPDDEIVVVDDGSDDDTVDVIERHRGRLPALRVIRGTGDGPGAATNLAVATARHDRILRLDGDDLITPGYVAAMTAALDHHGLVGAELRFDELVPADRRVQDPQGVGSALGHRLAHPSAALGFRREVFDEVGGFRPLPRLSDVDFCWRAGEAGHEVADAPGATIQYRLRSGVRPVWRQHVRSGRAQVALTRLHPEVRLPGARRTVVRLLTLLWHAPVRGTTVERTEWTAELGREWGRLLGRLTGR